jgi:hypothetical protein
VGIRSSATGIAAGLPVPVLRLPEVVPHSEWVSRASYAPSKDGTRFLVETLAPGVRQPPLQVILNWPALLQNR